MPLDDDYINDVLSKAKQLRDDLEKELESPQQRMERMHPLAMLQEAMNAKLKEDGFCHPTLLVIVDRHYDSLEESYIDQIHVYHNARAIIGQRGELSITKQIEGVWRMVAEYPEGKYYGWEREGSRVYDAE